ncbi:hypothetical protein EXIGLDRAFT_766359 [Exidia glandulosa HHB12029]|uniref:Fungal N-terminal domain-containing protein n=1 Tax=Exidia glandulosa HHB12029 TaxID=1314781 RepID=A0A165JRG9_EXIGL|nr:hypothetical protein EXIGLDRAFT_766359 [Exidia glandulosa HHB12029]
MSVLFTFGSFGDIGSVLQIAWAVRGALSEAASASEDVQSLIADIDSFTMALQNVKAVVAQTSDIPGSVQNGLAHALGLCGNILECVRRKVEAVHNAVVRAHGTGVWRGYWAACAWSVLGGKAEVDTLRRRLVDQLVVLQTLLSVLQSSSALEIDRRSRNEHVDAFHLIRSGHDMPARMKYFVPQHFFDFLGRPILPMQKMSYPASLH